MKKVAIYARVSTQKQEEQRTIMSQLLALRELAAKEELIKEYIDDGWSGTSLARPALDSLRDDIKEKKFDYLYVYDPDRLARNHIHLGIIQQELEKYKIQLVFANSQYSSNPEGKLLFGMQGLIAEYEREKILERLRRGRMRKAKQGNVVGSNPPYGYTYIKKNDKANGYYIVNLEESRIVKIIFQLFLKEKSIRAVARSLEKANIKPKGLKKYWAKSSISRILNNTSYIGTTYYNKYYSYETENGKRYKRNIKTGKKLRKKEEWVPIKVPEIIDENTFVLAQKLLSFNKGNLRPKKNTFLLSGLLKCGVCESSYVGDSCSGGKCYRCNSRHKKNAVLEKCTNKQIVTHKIEDVVWKEVSKALMNPNIITRQVEKLSERFKNKRERILDEISKLNELVELKEGGKKRLVKSYGEGHLLEVDFHSAIDEINKGIKVITDEKDSFKSTLETLEQEPQKKKDIIYFCTEVGKQLKSITEDKKREIIKLICEKITFNKDTVKINGIIPRFETDLQNGLSSTTVECCVHHWPQFPVHV